MIKFSSVTKTVTVDEPIAMVCDRCKKEISLDARDLSTAKDKLAAIGEMQEMLKISHRCGYAARIAGGDGSVIEAEVCQKCWWELLGPYCRVVEPSLPESL